MKLPPKNPEKLPILQPGARRIIRAAAECDAQVSALQALVRADRWTH